MLRFTSQRLAQKCCSSPEATRVASKGRLRPKLGVVSLSPPSKQCHEKPLGWGLSIYYMLIKTNSHFAHFWSNTGTCACFCMCLGSPVLLNPFHSGLGLSSGKHLALDWRLRWPDSGETSAGLLFGAKQGMHSFLLLENSLLGWEQCEWIKWWSSKLAHQRALWNYKPLWSLFLDLIPFILL